MSTTQSTLTFLRVQYAPNTTPALPERLLLKRPLKTDAYAGDLEQEVDFYARLAPQLSSPPALRCLASAGETSGTGTYLIFEDLRATHADLPWPLQSGASQGEPAVNALAVLHARWWESPELGMSIGTAHTSNSLRAMVNGIASQLPAFCDAHRDVLSTRRREILERVFSSSLLPWLRLTDTRALSITHGDAHAGNFLFPRKAGDPTYLIDWQLWHVDLGVRDVAFLLGLASYPDGSRETEVRLLRKYHDRLAALGVHGYSWDDLWLDYRRCIVRNLTIPILFWSRAAPREKKTLLLEGALDAFEHLGCEDVL
ncbi:MAG: aminoglycoside phosphotransferase family protein [Anaerolineae bacterium]|nr:aminoglycoside phosphotransferase family protein [Gemmatimonadaceae bacterium]